MGANFALIGVGRILNAANGFGFEVLPFFFEFGNGFGVGLFAEGEALGVTRLAAGAGAEAAAARGDESFGDFLFAA